MPVSSSAGGYSTTIPDHEASGNMVVEFSRNVASFPINKYSELRPVTKMKGFYLQIRPSSAGRVRYPDARDYAWAPASERPKGQDNQLQFQFQTYICERYAHSVVVDNLAVEQATWPVLESELRDKGQQAMTMITDLAISGLSSTSWNLNNSFVDASGGTPAGGSPPLLAGLAAGQNMGNGSPTSPNIKIALYNAAAQISKRTLGRVQPQDLVWVMSPDTAIHLSTSPEIQQMLSSSVYAYPVITGTLPGTQQNWSLPPKIYDFRVAIENTAIVQANKNNTGVDNPTWAIDTTTFGPGLSYLLTRKDNELINSTILKADEGAIAMSDEAREGVPIVSTLVRFALEEFTVEQKADTWNRIHDVSIAYNMQFVVTNPISGYQIQSMFG